MKKPIKQTKPHHTTPTNPNQTKHEFKGGEDQSSSIANLVQTDMEKDTSKNLENLKFVFGRAAAGAKLCRPIFMSNPTEVKLGCVELGL